MDHLKVYAAIHAEREYQYTKHGDHKHSVGDWLTILRVKLRDAEDAFMGGDRHPLCEILKIAASAVTCLEQNGVVERKDLP